MLLLWELHYFCIYLSLHRLRIVCCGIGHCDGEGEGNVGVCVCVCVFEFLKGWSMGHALTFPPCIRLVD